MSPKPKRPRPPSHLRVASKAWWIAVVTEYKMEPHHLKLLAQACQALDRAEQAREVLASTGLTFIDKNGYPRPRPEVAIERDSRLAYVRIVRELKLDQPPADSRPPRLGRSLY